MTKRGILIVFGVVLILIGGWFYYSRVHALMVQGPMSQKQTQMLIARSQGDAGSAHKEIGAADFGGGVAFKRSLFNEAFGTPIAFYGRVVDQFGDVVPDAKIVFSANDKEVGSNSKYYTKTDANGLFAINGIAGITLWVDVSKVGYRKIPKGDAKIPSAGFFQYYDVGGGVHVPHKNSPVMFQLQKVGTTEALVKIEKKNLRISRNGIPLSISLDQNGGHWVVLRCWNKEIEAQVGQYQYDWRFEITVPDGGILIRKDMYEFQVPEKNFVSGDVVEMQAALPKDHWRSFLKRSYYMRFADGTYARANLEVQAGGDHFVVWESLYNPKPGSRNLESDSGN